MKNDVSLDIALIVVCHMKNIVSWWHHQMETFSALLVLCEGNPPVTGGFPSKRPVTWCCFIWYAPEQMIEQAIKMLVIWVTITLIMTSL